MKKLFLFASFALVLTGCASAGTRDNNPETFLRAQWGGLTPEERLQRIILIKEYRRCDDEASAKAMGLDGGLSREAEAFLLSGGAGLAVEVMHPSGEEILAAIQATPCPLVD